MPDLLGKRLRIHRAATYPARVRQLLERIAEAIQQTRPEIEAYKREHPEFEDIGKRMLQEWESGVNTSLRG